MSKEYILNSMHQLLSYNVIGDLQYKNRYNGFNGELDFSLYCKNKELKTLPGGVFVPLVNTDISLTKDSLYILSVPTKKNEIEHLNEIKEQLRLASKVSLKGGILVTFDIDEDVSSWNLLNIKNNDNYIRVPYPSSLKIYIFNQEDDSFSEISIDGFKSFSGLDSCFKHEAVIPNDLRNYFFNKLNRYDLSDLIELYVSRFVLDGLCSRHGIKKSIQRGAPLDVDLFVLGKDKEWKIIDIKEKNLSRNNCFGMDTRRIESFLTLQNIFSKKAYYVVRHINNQNDRAFVDWKIILMSKFDQKSPKREVEGGTGMRSENSSNPTRLCNLIHFQSLS